MNQLRSLLRLNARKGEFKAEANTIYLYDVIVSDEADAEWGGVAPKAFIDALKAMSGTVHLRINSPGGDVFGATAMAQAMREYKGEIVAHIDGLAASAASVIAAGADRVVMAPGSMLMIHNSWTLAFGNRNDFRATADLLEKVDGQIAQAYAAKSGGTAADFAPLMDAETWFTPEEAVSAKLADEIAADKPKAYASWDLSVFAKAPQAMAPVTTVTTCRTVTTTIEEEVETETVEVIQGDPAMAPADAALSEIAARQRKANADLRRNPA